MNALIFAAGLGTRLQEVTKNIPKALVEVDGKPMLWHAVQKLTSIGVKRIVVNVHHYAENIEEYINQLQIDGVEILISNEKDELLETGGGLLKAAPLFIKEEPIILYNADVITGADLNEMVHFHNEHGGVATLMVKKRETSRYFLFDEKMRLSGWENVKTKEHIFTRPSDKLYSYAFSGIHIVNPEILTMLGEVRKFSITPGYLEISDKQSIFGWKDWDEYWFDIGTPEKLSYVNDFFKK